MRMFSAMMLTAGALTLAGCGETKLLTSKTAPDETAVVDGPSLALPPQFDLRPPREAKDYDAAVQEKADETVHSLVTGVSGTAKVVSSSTGASADVWLLKKVGDAQPGIRDELSGEVQADKEKAKASQAKKGILSRWFGSRDE